MTTKANIVLFNENTNEIQIIYKNYGGHPSHTIPQISPMMLGAVQDYCYLTDRIRGDIEHLYLVHTNDDMDFLGLHVFTDNFVLKLNMMIAMLANPEFAVYLFNSSGSLPNEI